MINNLGGLSVLEMNIIAGEVIKQLGAGYCFLNI
jgi:dihydroxyacetone kinase